jgi:ABC-type molybdate transport system ATPase subunit
VRKNLLFGAPNKKHDGPTIDFDEVVELLGIRALLDRSPRNLSGGERQRVGIGRALLTQPKVLLMMRAAQRGGQPAWHESVHELHALDVARGRHDLQ